MPGHWDLKHHAALGSVNCTSSLYSPMTTTKTRYRATNPRDTIDTRMLKSLITMTQAQFILVAALLALLAIATLVTPHFGKLKYVSNPTPQAWALRMEPGREVLEDLLRKYVHVCCTSRE